VSIELCCPKNWPAPSACRAYGAPGPHGCRLRPGHDGGHVCPCGSRHPKPAPKAAKEPTT